MLNGQNGMTNNLNQLNTWSTPPSLNNISRVTTPIGRIHSIGFLVWRLSRGFGVEDDARFSLVDSSCAGIKMKELTSSSARGARGATPCFEARATRYN